MYAFSADALEYVKIPELKVRLNRIMGQKLNVDLDLEL